MRLENPIVAADIGPQPDLLEHQLLLTLASLALALGLLVLEAAVIQDLANGGIGGGGDLYEVEIAALGEIQGLFNAQDAKLRTMVVDQAHLADLDLVVRSKLFAYVLLLLMTGCRVGHFRQSITRLHRKSMPAALLS